MLYFDPKYASGDWKTRKEMRRKAYILEQQKVTIDCVACNGSGFYDSFRSPKCSSCNGTGKERVLKKDL